MADATRAATACRIKTRHDRPEDRMISVTDKRLLLINLKTPAKPEMTINLLDLLAIKGTNDEVSFVSEGATLTVSDCKDTLGIAQAIVNTLREHFPDAPQGRLVPSDIALRETPTRVSDQPCGRFLAAYHLACDFLELQRDDGVKDTIEHMQNTRARCFRGDDFGLCDTRDAPALLMALHRNTWFTAVDLQDVKLRPEVSEMLAVLVQRTFALNRLTLVNIGVRPEFWPRLADCLARNVYQPITALDLSSNALEEKGCLALANAIETLPNGLSELVLNGVGMTTKAASAIAAALKANSNTAAVLQRLAIANNNIGVDGVTSFMELLSGRNVLSVLDISSTNCQLENVFTSLGNSVSESLVTLKLGGNRFTTRKQFKASPAMTQWIQTIPTLRLLDLADSRLPPDVLRTLIAGMSANPMLVELDLSLASCELSACLPVVLELFPKNCVSTLSLADNDFSETDLVKLCGALSQSSSLRSLTLDRNMARAKTRAPAVQALVELLARPDSVLSSLSLADMKLKQELFPLLEALGRDCNLSSLDVSGNALGDAGAHVLAAALHNNTRLRTLKLDDNQITSIGYREIAAGVAASSGLRALPLPMTDVLAAARVAPTETGKALVSIGASLCEHHMPSRYVSAQGEADTHAPRQLLLDSLLQDTVGRNADPAAIGDALRAQEALKGLRTKEADLIKARISQVQGRLQSLTAALSELLSDQMQDTVTLLANTITEDTGLDGRQAPMPLQSEYSHLFTELVDDVIGGVASQLFDTICDQTHLAVQRAGDFILQRTIERLQTSLTGRKDAGQKNWRQSMAISAMLASDLTLPEPAAAPQPPPAAQEPSHSSASWIEAQARDEVAAEAPISFEAKPDQAAGALEHQCKGRPRPGNRRPPTRVARAAQGFEEPVESVINLKAVAALASPAPSPARPPVHASMSAGVARPSVSADATKEKARGGTLFSSFFGRKSSGQTSKGNSLASLAESPPGPAASTPPAAAPASHPAPAPSHPQPAPAAVTTSAPASVPTPASPPSVAAVPAAASATSPAAEDKPAASTAPAAPVPTTRVPIMPPPTAARRPPQMPVPAARPSLPAAPKPQLVREPETDGAADDAPPAVSVRSSVSAISRTASMLVSDAVSPPSVAAQPEVDAVPPPTTPAAAPAATEAPPPALLVTAADPTPPAVAAAGEPAAPEADSSAAGTSAAAAAAASLGGPPVARRAPPPRPLPRPSKDVSAEPPAPAPSAAAATAPAASEAAQLQAPPETEPNSDV